MSVMTKTRIPTRHRAADQQALADEIERRRVIKGMNRRQLSIAAGLNPRYVRDLVERGKKPQADALHAIAQVLRCSVEDLQTGAAGAAPSRSEAQLRSARFRAARWACWEEPRDGARRLGIGVVELTNMEAGFIPVPESLLLRFAGLTGCPLSWLQEGGRMDRMNPELAARIVFFDPGLLPPRDEE